MADGPLFDTIASLEPQLRRIANRSKCDDVIQNVDDLLTELWIRLQNHPVPAEAYVVAAFKNLVRNCGGKCHRRKARDVEYMQNRPAACPSTAESHASRKEQRWHIKRAVRLANLRRDHRCALWAWCRGSLDEFARRRGVRERTARVWAYRARQALRPHLDHLH